jgi:hypothetical protein
MPSFVPAAEMLDMRRLEWHGRSMMDRRLRVDFN